MPCLSPIDVRRPDWAVVRRFISVPCGRCEGCLLERRRNWQVRIMHEAQMHKENCFLTLTYRDDELSYGRTQATLVKSDLQRFWKRLRKECECGIRYFACGEYGERRTRPHYHAVVFGFDFQDKVLLSTAGDNNLFSSATLDRIWTHGHCSVGALTPGSAAYVAGYVMDKKLGQKEFYANLGIEPEYVVMSRKPGIGRRWFDKYASDIYPADRCLTEGGHQSKPPRYYDELRKETHPEQMIALKAARMEKMENIPFEELLAKRALSRIRFYKNHVKNISRKLHA